MSKLSTQDCKEALIKYLTPAMVYELKKEFTNNDHAMIDTESVKISNWKRTSKSRVEHDTNAPLGSIERTFDCKPFDDQLRAYVYTDSKDEIILSIIVQGE